MGKAFDTVENRMETKQLNGMPKVVSKGKTEFVLNEKYRWYEGSVYGTSIILSMDKSTEDCQTALKVFESYETIMPEMDQKLKDYVVRTLLADANAWREDDGEPAISEEEFYRMIFITGLSFNSDGTVDAFYNDGGIFAGHSIVVNINVNGAITGTDIAG